MTMTDDLKTLIADKTVDARGTACPGPLLEAKKAIGAVRIGQIVEVQSGDSSSRSDIPVWANKVGHEYLGLVEADGFDRHFLRRKR
jgi:tRNA 2-thiouridine synthesizing protein A